VLSERFRLLKDKAAAILPLMRRSDKIQWLAIHQWVVVMRRRSLASRLATGVPPIPKGSVPTR